MASITINGNTVKVKNGTTILNAAKDIGIEIPTLCFIKEINEIGFCRICVVEVEGEQDLISACNTEIKNGMVIETDSDKVIESRENTLQLLAANHRFDCWRCPKDGICEFYDLLKKNDILFEEFGPGIARKDDLILGTGISMDQSKCVLCKRCVAVCNDVVTAKVLKFRDDDGMNPFVSPTVGLAFDETGCTFCGQCVKVCPTGTLFETEHIALVEEMIKNPSKTVVVQVSDSAKAGIGEEFGFDIGKTFDEVEGKMFNAFRLLGFDEITDTTIGEDLMILEESQELLDRLTEGKTLPLFNSSCPAAVRYSELFHSEHLEKLSTSKSPHVTQGVLIKNHFAKEYLNKKPKDVFVVSIMPCIAKKYEISRPELEVDSVRDVDAVLTIREIAKMIKRKGFNLPELKPFTPESNFAKETLSKGVKSSNTSETEKVLNALSDKVDHKPVAEIKFKITYGNETEISKGIIKEATVVIGTHKLNVAIASGGNAMKEMYNRLDTGKKKYHYVEFLSCGGGCLNGGGMPIEIDLPMHDIIKKRESLQFLKDSELPLRIPGENKAVLKVYEKFLTSENSKDSHKYCHTHFSKKEYRNE